MHSLAIRKLFALVNGKCSSETTDSPMNQEVLLGGHLYLMALKVEPSLQVYADVPGDDVWCRKSWITF